MAEADDRPLLSLDPPLYADDFLPALWVPLTRAVRARRRLVTLNGSLKFGSNVASERGNRQSAMS